MAASQARSQAERLYESLASPPLQADLPLEIVDLYVLVAAITGARLVIAGAPDPAIEAPLAQQVVPTVLVETLAGDQLRLRHAVSAAEELATALTQLAAALHASGDRAMAAVVGRQAEAISSLAKSDAPPPRSINAAMLDGQEMLRSHTTRAEIEAALLADGFSADDATRRAAQIETLEAAFELPHDDDGVGYSNALAELARFGESLQTDDDAAAPDGTSRLRELTRDGLEDGYKKLLAALVVGSPIALLAGLRWLTQYHFNLATMYKFAIGIVKARTGL
jgi:hypothetical protein